MLTALRCLTSCSSKSKAAYTLFSLCSFWLIVVCSSCARTESTLVEHQPAYQPTPSKEQSNQLNLPKLSPKPTEVHDAVKRVFKDVAVVDASLNPNFIVGDFNGDASQDLAVVVKPATGKLDAINEVYPAWLLRDPFVETTLPNHQLRVSENESLLAVIHGYGSSDWRDPQATQTFLLKNAAGRNLETTTSVDFVRSNSGRRIPRLRGDVISEVVGGIQGCIYFERASYRWYDPKTFRDETTAPPTVHGRNGQMSK